MSQKEREAYYASFTLHPIPQVDHVLKHCGEKRFMYQLLAMGLEETAEM